MREWLSHHAASNYIGYDAATQSFAMPPEQAMILADEDSPVYPCDAFDAAAGHVGNQAKVQETFRPARASNGAIRPHACSAPSPVSSGRDTTPTLSRSGFRLSTEPSRNSSAAPKVADAGCGHGYSTMIMAEAFPNSEFIGFDFHPASVEEARAHARGHRGGNVRFEVATAKSYPGNDYDLVTFFDCLHHMGHPAGAARHGSR